MAPFTTVALSAALMAVTNAKTLIIGGGPAGVHMGYKLAEREVESCIWEMTDQLGGKAGNQYEQDGITMNTGVNFLPSSYRDFFELLDELGMKNLNDAINMAAPKVVDKHAFCLLMKGLDETKCQDLTVYPEPVQTILSAPDGLLGLYSLLRGLLLMKEEGYFDTFVAETTAMGFDWTADELNIPQLVGLQFQRFLVTEIPTYVAFMDQYTDGAFTDFSNLDNDFNKHLVYEKSDDAVEALNQSISEFMQEKDIFFFRVIFEEYISGVGYGELVDTPMYYAGKMMNPDFVQFWIGNVNFNNDAANFLNGVYIMEGGLPSVLDNMVTKQNLDVTFNREVTKVVLVEEDDSSYFEVYYKDNNFVSPSNRKLEKSTKSEKSTKKSSKANKSSKKGSKTPPNMERFDQIISGMSSQSFVKLYNKGKDIEGPILCREACAWSSTIAEVVPSDAIAAEFAVKSSIFDKGGLYLEDPNPVSTALLDPLSFKNVVQDGPSRRMQMYHQYKFEPALKGDPQALTKQELDTLFNERYGPGGIEIKEVYSTVIVPNYAATSKNLDTCDPWDLHEMQGKNGLYFIGGTVSLDNLEVLIRYNNYVLDTHF